MALFTSYRVSSGEQQILLADRTYRADGTRRGVLVTHGAGVDATAFLTQTYQPPVANCARLGYPCLAVDQGGSLTFGNDASITAMTTDWGVLTSAGFGAKSDKVLVYGGSMGALAALNWARQNSSIILGAFLTIPALDLNDIYQNNKGSEQANIGTAYGVTFPSALPGLSTHSPVAYPADVRGFPIQIYASDDDPVASNTAACQTWATAVGSNVTVGSIGAQGHSAASLDPMALVNWLDSVGGRN